jgi:hypothetical protein
LVLLAATQAVADEPRREATTDNKLVGTWRAVSAKHGAQEVKWPEGTSTVKHVTPAQFMWATYDKDGTVIQAVGGRYTLQGEDYTETPEYGVGRVFERLKGQTLRFQCKVEGNRWYHTARSPTGATVAEVWERVEKK